jgi:channel protein (hemolysin III family)
LSLYLVMGWAAAPIAGEVIENVQPETWLLVMVSGGLYTFGVIFHLWER